jgi:hypothetical protein
MPQSHRVRNVFFRIAAYDRYIISLLRKVASTALFACFLRTTAKFHVFLCRQANDVRFPLNFFLVLKAAASSF